MPARVAFITALAVRLPAATQAPMRALVTPLQLQTWAVRRHFVEGDLLRRRAEVEQQRQPLVRQRLSRSKACIRKAALLMSPIRMPPTRRPSRTISFL